MASRCAALHYAVLCRIIYNSNQTGSGAYATWLMAPTYFPRGGVVYSDSVQGAGSNGGWWSSTVNSATTARNLSLHSGAVYPERNNYRYNGFSLRRTTAAPRCVFIAPCHAILYSNQTGSGAYTTWLMAPTYFPRGGHVYSDSVRFAGTGGYWWSSTVSSATTVRNLTLYSGAVNPESLNGRYYGFSLWWVSCLLRATANIRCET